MLRILFVLMIAATSAAAGPGPSKQSVNDYGADPTGVEESRKAFIDAMFSAGDGGIVTCDPGTYKLKPITIIWANMTIDCPATLIPELGSPFIFRVGEFPGFEKTPRHIEMNILHMDGRNLPGLRCLDISGVSASFFNIRRMTNCETAVHIEPDTTNTADNYFQGGFWEFNGTAIKVACDQNIPHAQSSRFNVNFVANNVVGIDVVGHNCAAMFHFVGSLDQFDRGVDGWVMAPNSYVRTSYVTPHAQLEVSDSTFFIALAGAGETIVRLGNRTLVEP